MTTGLKNSAASAVLGTKGIITSESSTPYVEDLRKVLTHKGKICIYPKNYDKLVKYGKIKKDKDGNYKLVFGKKDEHGKRPKFDLELVKEADDNKSYFTIKFPCSIDDLDETYITPFGFSTLGFTQRGYLKKYAPIFEIDTKLNKLVNSSVLTKIENGKEVPDPEARNGQFLFTSHSKNFNISVWEFRGRNGELEFDKSLISVPIVVVSVIVNDSVKLLVYLPEKLGEYLRGRQDLVSKFFGNCLLIPTKAVKNITELLTTVTKTAPALLLTGGEKKKYADSYVTISLAQFKECFGKIKGDWNTIFTGVQNDKTGEQKKPPNFEITGTWKELNALRTKIEQDLEEVKSRESLLPYSKGAEIVSRLPKNSIVAGEQMAATPRETNYADREKTKPRSSGIRFP